MLNKKSTVNIPPLLENGLFVTNIETKATVLNRYFVVRCSIIPNASTLPRFVPRRNPLLHSLPIDPGKVLQHTRYLYTKKANGCDEISISIKICDSLIVKPICLIFEKCLEEGVYTSLWKKANILVHKKGNRQCKKNYGPISLLPNFGKIFEKLIFDSIYCHLCENSIITAKQSGFRPGDSTINQLLSITHKIYSSFEELPSKETLAVFLDFAKAFDRVWHDGLIYKLESSVISGSLLGLIRNCLADRK